MAVRRSPAGEARARGGGGREERTAGTPPRNRGAVMLGRTRPNALAGLYRRFSAATDEWAFLSWARENKWDQDAGEKPLPNYFQVFGVDPGTFDVSADELEAKYKTLQKVLHPDKLGAAGNERGRTLGELYSAHVNEAYGTLRPLFR